MVRLADLCEQLGGELVHAASATAKATTGAAVAADVVVEDVTLDSRELSAGSLFAALPGRSTDGGRYAGEALAVGAVAVLAGAPLALDGPLWVHPDARHTAGLAAALTHGEPAQQLFTAAVTGTNGKTSVCHLAAQLLEAQGRSPAVLGTVGHRLAGAAEVAARHTTPDAPTLHRLLARHLSAGGDSALLEASSHGLDQDRLAGVEPSVAVYTGLSRDHLDYHADVASYAAAKRRLFDQLPEDGLAIIGERDEHAESMVTAALERGARILRYGSSPAADVALVRRVPTHRGQELRVRLPRLGELDLELPLVGEHNAENLLAALAVALEAARQAGAKLSAEALASVVRELVPAPGRLERVVRASDLSGAPSADPTGHRTGPAGPDPAVWVDYAHTPDALARALAALREGLSRGRLWVVFGCGGDRDRGKRGAMGAAAARGADRVVITSDNPRGEDPAEIAAAIAQAARGAGAEPLLELDRATAIRTAILGAAAEDVVLIAGKGHETWQVVGAERLPFDDRLVAREVLA